MNLVRTSGPNGGTVSRHRLLQAIELTRDVDDRLLWRLTKWEQDRLVRGEGNYDMLDKLTRDLPPGVNVDDLLDVLPRPGSFEENILKLSRRQAKPEPTDRAAA